MFLRFFWEMIWLGARGLLLHKLRSGLAMLGILIGVTAVIWLVALGEGVSYQAQQQIKDLGATNIIIKSVKPASAATQGNTLIVSYGLTRADFDRIATLPTVQRAVPMREAKSEAWAGSRKAEVRLVGCSPAYMRTNHLQVDRGRFLSNLDQQSHENVVVLAAESAEELFAHQDPIGGSVQLLSNLNLDIYRVVGVTESRLPSAAIGGSLEGRDYNRDVYIPLSTFRHRIGDLVSNVGTNSPGGEEVELSQITVTVGDAEQVQQTADIIQILLEKYHKQGDYAVVIPQELLRQAEMLQMMFNVLLVLIAGISLLVGGIGIMNIMLATIVERTGEIGVRRALGATKNDITRQFLAETLVLATAGGLLGVAAGFLCHPAVSTAMSAIEQWLPDVWLTMPPAIRNLEPIIAPWSIVAAFAISVGVGVLFGTYPALRAASLDPIEALRHQ